MKIIKKGKLPEEKEFDVTCPSCNTIFVFTSTEAIHNKNDGYSIHGTYSIRCPICANVVYTLANKGK